MTKTPPNMRHVRIANDLWMKAKAAADDRVIGVNRLIGLVLDAGLDRLPDVDAFVRPATPTPARCDVHEAGVRCALDAGHVGAHVARIKLEPDDAEPSRFRYDPPTGYWVDSAGGRLHPGYRVNCGRPGHANCQIAAGDGRDVLEHHAEGDVA